MFLFCTPLLAEENSISLGTGLYSQTQPYKKSKNLILPSPVIFFDNSLLYIRWTRVGIYFMGEKNDNLSWGLSLTALPRTISYKSNISSVKDKKSTWEGGVSFGISKENYYAELLLLHDLLNNHKSYVTQFELGSEYKIYNATFYPSISFFYQSSEFINYYYEPKKKDSGINFALQTYINYPLSQNLSTFLHFKVEKLSKKITNSSLVTDKVVYSSLFSLIYTYHYN